MRGKLSGMRAVAVFMLLMAALAAGTSASAGSASASHRAARAGWRDAASPSWSPNGKQIDFTYVRYGQSRCCGLVPSRWRIVRASSGRGRVVRTILPAKSSLAYESPLWVAGGRILFGSAGILKTVKVHAGRPQRVVFPGCKAVSRCYESNFILSPNRRIAAVTACDCGDPHLSSGIQLVKLGAGRPVVLSTPLTAEEEADPIIDQVLAFSPDSEQLVFSRASWDAWEGAGSPVLLAIRLDGGGPVPLSQSGIPGASLVPSNVQQVQWSPDGRWVAFVENQSLEVVPTSGGSAPRALATDFGPCATRGDGFSWSPTSRLIAYDGCPDQGDARLMTVRPDGTHLTDLSKRLTYDSEGTAAGGPQWSPDGSRLVFLAHGVDQVVHVWTIRANGRDLTRRG